YVSRSRRRTSSFTASSTATSATIPPPQASADATAGGQRRSATPSPGPHSPCSASEQTPDRMDSTCRQLRPSSASPSSSSDPAAAKEHRLGGDAADRAPVSRPPGALAAIQAQQARPG